MESMWHTDDTAPHRNRRLLCARDDDAESFASGLGAFADLHKWPTRFEVFARSDRERENRMQFA